MSGEIQISQQKAIFTSLIIFFSFTSFVLLVLYLIVGSMMFSIWEILAKLVMFFFVMSVVVYFFLRKKARGLGTGNKIPIRFKSNNLFNTPQKAQLVLLFGLLLVGKSVVDIFASTFPSYFSYQLGIGFGASIAGGYNLFMLKRLAKEKNTVYSVDK